MENRKSSGFHHLCEEVVFIILDKLEESPSDVKAFTLVCKSFYTIESRHRKSLKPQHEDDIVTLLKRYSRIQHLDLSLVSRVDDKSLIAVSNRFKETLKSIILTEVHFYPWGLSKVAVNCKNLVDIDLSKDWTEDKNWVKDRMLISVAKAENLERLSLAHCELITDVGVSQVAEGCRKLRFLSLNRCTRVSDVCVGLIATKCIELRSLDVSALMITRNCLPQILELQYLEHLVLASCVIDEESVAVPKLGCCKSLKSLDMTNTGHVSHVVWSSLASSNGLLWQINLSINSRTDVLLYDTLQSLATLQSLNLSDCTVECSGLNAIGNWCCSLKELNLKMCKGVTDEGLSPIFTKHRDLQKVDISQCEDITCASIIHLMSSCASLVSLKMVMCSQLSAEAFVAIGQHCQLLEELDVSHCRINDEGLKSISRCPQLSSLELTSCSYISDKGLIQHIATSCPKLKELLLFEAHRITASGILAVLRGCPGVKKIGVTYCESMIEAIAGCDRDIMGRIYVAYSF